MKIDDVKATIILSVKDFPTFEDALKKATALVATLLQTRYTAILHVDGSDIWIDYAFDEDAIPLYMDKEEWRAWIDWRNKSGEN